MDREFELLKRIKAENDKDFSATPKRLSLEELDEGTKKVMSNFYTLYKNEDKQVEEEKKLLIENLYAILDILVKMGIHPGFIFNKICEYNRERIIKGDIQPAGAAVKKRNTVFFPYGEVKEELKKMQDYNYQGHNISLDLCYDSILTMNKELKLPYSKIPTVLDKSRKDSYYADSYSCWINLINADDITEESVYLVKLLYNVVSMLVEMGIDPYKLLENKIYEENEKGKLY